MAAPSHRPDESSLHFRLIAATPRPRELTGAVDLLSYYGLRNHYETGFRTPLPVSIGEGRYLKNVVGNTDIRKGEGMELGQLLGPDAENCNEHIHEFDLDVLRQAFSLRVSAPILLPEADCGIPTISGAVKEELKNKDKKHKKHKKHKDRNKDREKDKDKERHKDRGKEDKQKDKEKEKVREKEHNKKRENGDDRSKKHHKKKRKHNGNDEDGEKHKKKKHKHSSKAEVPMLTKSRT